VPAVVAARPIGSQAGTTSGRLLTETARRGRAPQPMDFLLLARLLLLFLPPRHPFRKRFSAPRTRGATTPGAAHCLPSPRFFRPARTRTAAFSHLPRGVFFFRALGR